MFCSTIIPTIGRPSLDRAVRSAVVQGLGRDAEVIVVNDSGKALTSLGADLMGSVRIIDTHRIERSCARNVGALVARGDYLHFLDDDDWLWPHALDCMRQATASTHAAWYYGRTQVVDRDGKPMVVLAHALNGNCFVQVLAGEWIPLQASLIDTHSFSAIGGFNETITGPEDIDLLRRIALNGDLCEVPITVATVAMGSAGSSTNYRAHPVQSRAARESILDDARAFSRMAESASTSEWHARMTRIYLTSAVWNVAHGQPRVALQRLHLARRALAGAGLAALSPRFWSTVLSLYSSPAFAQAQVRE